MPDAQHRLALQSVLIVLALAWSAAALTAVASHAGRPVIDVLRELRGPGLEFIFSSNLLPPTLRVLSEPSASSRLVLAAEILAPHGLSLSAIRPGLYAVVSSRQAVELGGVSGQVLDAVTDRPLSVARAELRPIGLVRWSGSDGRFVISDVPAGDYVLRLSAPGYEAVELQHTVAAAQSGVLEVRLVQAPVALEEIVVATSRYALSDDPSSPVLLHGADIAVQPGLGEDALRALARLPGIAQSGLSAQSNVRGGEAGDVLIRLDGFVLRQAFHMPGYQSPVGVLDPGLIRDVEVFTGGFPARYGNRMAGVFDLTTIDPADAPRHALGLSVFNASARLGGSTGRLDGRWLAAARASTLRPVLKALAPEAGDPTYGDVYSRLQFGEPDRLRVSGNVLWSRDELEITRPENAERAQIESRSRYLWLRADRHWEADLDVVLWAGHSRLDSVRTGVTENPDVAVGSAADARSSEFWDVRAELNWRVNDRHKVEAGLSWTDESAGYRYLSQVSFAAPIAALFDRAGDLARDLDLQQARRRAAAFVTHRWRLGDAWVSDTGLRVQTTLTPGLAHEWLYDPRVSVRWQLSSATSLRLHWGRFHQTDEVHELKVEDGLTQFPVAQRADHMIAGLEHQMADGWALRFEAFRKQQSAPRPRFENQLTRLSLIPDLAPDRVMLLPGAAEVEGVELTISHEGLNSRQWASASWSDSVDAFRGAEVPRSWDQTWAISAGADWEKGAWHLSAIASAHTGWPTTSLQHGALGARNMDRLPAFASLDLRAAYHRPLAVGALTLALEVTNALNRNNICCSDLAILRSPDGSTLVGTRDRSWLPLVPAVSVLWEF